MDSSATYILQINTALMMASVSISKNGLTLSERTSSNQYEHASFVQPAILEMLNELKLELSEMHAISVVNGPGSYTGLRVGLSSAKGLCFALNIPLICINTLEWMADVNKETSSDLICPMIDARRNEVFTAVYHKNGQTLLETQAMILAENSFAHLLAEYRMDFFGDGATKWAAMNNHPNAIFKNISSTSTNLSFLSFQAYQDQKFADLAYAEPFYAKVFYSTQSK